MWSNFCFLCTAELLVGVCLYCHCCAIRDFNDLMARYRNAEFLNAQCRFLWVGGLMINDTVKRCRNVMIKRNVVATFQLWSLLVGSFDP